MQILLVIIVKEVFPAAFLKFHQAVTDAFNVFGRTQNTLDSSGPLDRNVLIYRLGQSFPLGGLQSTLTLFLACGRNL